MATSRILHIGACMAALWLGPLACGGGGGGGSTPPTPPPPAPTISAFTATPTHVTPGQSSTLAWTASGATTLSLDQGIGAVTGTSTSVSPSATTVYTLTATNPGGTVIATATVNVGPAPLITSFTATPTHITAGQTSTLAWSVSGATSLSINQGVGTVTGTSSGVTPSTTTTYTLTATNAFGSSTATATVNVGTAPLISSFTATPGTIGLGSSSTLGWTVTGATSLSLDQGIGAVVGSSTPVSPSATTTYQLTATNLYGTSTAQATVTVVPPPVITAFSASPASIASGQSSMLSWTVSAGATLSIDQGVGPVTGPGISVSPTTTTTYTLTATTLGGTVTATTTVTVGALPVISSLTSTRSYVMTGQFCTLNWATSGATSLSLDQGLGTVTGSTSQVVSPASTTRYTLTATNAFGSVTATVQVDFIALAQVSSGLQPISTALYRTEHCLFLIPDPGSVTFPTWSSIYASGNIDAYVAQLKALYPDDFMMVAVMANNLTPNTVPNVLTYRHLADGIGQGSITGVGVPNICRYNIGGGTVIDGCLGVFDHEIGHNWGVQIGIEVGSGHWYPNTTAYGQLASSHSSDGYVTVDHITGDPVNGFAVTTTDNLVENEHSTFSIHDLYAMGLQPTFSDLYVFAGLVYNGDGTISYSGVTKYDHAWAVGKNGPRVPSYQTSEKQFRLGFVYIAKDLAEVQAAYAPVERSITHFENAEAVDTVHFRFQVPFLVDTAYRASVRARLSDMDGNTAPTLALTGSAYLTSADGTASVGFTAADTDGPTPTVALVPSSPYATVGAGAVSFSGLPSGTHFFTLKAQDAFGKKAFVHFVIDVS